MFRPRTFVAIDLGATSGRVTLSRLDGDGLSLKEIHRFPNQPVSYHGELHWNMPDIWHQIRTGLDALASMDVTSIDSVGVDSWGVDYALLGESGTLVENPYHYRDARTDGIMDLVRNEVGADRIYDSTGVQFMSMNTLYQLYAASRKTPRLLAAADHLVTIPDLVNFWLTGVIACEYTNASTTQFLSRNTRLWASGLLRDLSIPTHFLTEIVPPGTVLGPVQPGVSCTPALKNAVVTVPSCHDIGSAIASVRATGGVAFLRSGTWSVLGTEVSEPIVTSTARDLNFTNEGGVCETIRLLKYITGLWLLEACRKKWGLNGARCSWPELVSSVHRTPSLRSLIDPDDRLFVRPADMSCAIDRFCRETSQPHPRDQGEYVRTVLESLALKYRMVLDELEVVTGRTFSAVRVIGGGARHDVLNQLTADATGRTVIAGPAEATTLGNVAMQMLACGSVRTLDEARDLIGSSRQSVQFQPSSSPHWEAAYQSFRTILAERGAHPADL